MSTLINLALSPASEESFSKRGYMTLHGGQVAEVKNITAQDDSALFKVASRS